MADKNYYGNQGQVNVTPGITVTYNYIQSPELREKLSENAIHRIQSYTIETMAAEHDRIFQKLSAERRELRN